MIYSQLFYKFGKIINVSKVFAGKSHDFKIRKESDKIPTGVKILADSGYQGIHKLHKNSYTLLRA